MSYLLQCPQITSIIAYTIIFKNAVNCIAEIKDNNGEWVNIGWVVMPYNGGHGVRATQYGDKIHLYVGDIYIHSYSNGANEKYLYTPGGIYGQTSAECRIKVWSIGKLKK